MKNLKYLILISLLIPLLSSRTYGIDIKYTHIIEMDENGFSPSDLTITVGAIVIFNNSGTEDHWPASNIHPTHQIYPEFDSKKPIKPGGKWRFVFTKAGNWRMHDHLYPEHTGTITVTAPEKSNNQSDKKSESSFNKFFDLIKGLFKSMLGVFSKNNSASIGQGMAINDIVEDTKILTGYIKASGVKEAMSRLVTESGGGSVFDCHQQAHNIGRIGYTVEGESAFQQCDSSCHSGCYHGAMESFLNQTGTVNIAQNIDRICKKFQTSFGIFECLHGVGHGILAYLDYNMPSAIAECKNLKDSFSTSSCYGGLFMENILTGQGLGASKDAHQTSWLKKDDPYFPCNNYGDDNGLQYQCYQMQTSWMLTLNGYNFDTAAKECLGAPPNMIPVCMKSLGRDAAGDVLRDPAKILAICNKVPRSYSDECLVGALNVIIDFWGPSLKNQATELCKLTSGSNKRICYTNLISRIGGIFKNIVDRQAICNEFELEYKKLCLNIHK